MNSLNDMFDASKTVSRKEAKSLGLKFYFTNVPCKKGHIGNRYVNNSKCQVCQKERDVRKYAEVDKPSYVAKQRTRALRRRYGMTDQDYEELFLAQNGMCAICNREEQVHRNGKKIRLAVDHCHTIGHVRGLLCNSCNKYVLGMLENNPGALQRLLEYLRR